MNRQMTPERLRALLVLAGVNGNELSRRLGVSRRAVSYWFAGERGISDERREQIERALGVRLPS